MAPMSLHNSLINLFESSASGELSKLLYHSDYLQFIQLHNLDLPADAIAIAFTHASFSHEYQVLNQETLEFLGDSVLQLIISEELIRRYPQEKEGKLSKLRSSLVNEKSLASLAQALNLGQLILVGKGEFKKQLFNQEVVLADTLEAVIGQIYRFKGFSFTQELVLKWFAQYLSTAFELSVLDEFDAKSKLQEATLAKYKTLPRYSAETRGTNFLVQLWVNEKLMAEGEYSSKKSGERELAQKVLKEKLF
jgi:ribonuclease III